MGTLAIVYISLLDDEWKGQPRILTLRIFTVLQKYLLTFINFERFCVCGIQFLFF